METDTDEIYKYTDTNDDGVSDKKELFYKGAGRIGQNLEHQPSGFIWAMDNWIYSTYNAVPPALDAEGRGAEGDDRAERRPVGPDPGRLRQGVVRRRRRRARPDQLPDADPVYGAFNVDDQFDDDFRVVWPAYAGGHADTQGGMGRVRMPVGVLNHFTATCGQDIFRGHRLPDDLRGDLLFAEPVGRLIRRAKVSVTPGHHAARERLPGLGVHHQHRSALPAR